MKIIIVYAMIYGFKKYVIFFKWPLASGNSLKNLTYVSILNRNLPFPANRNPYLPIINYIEL